MYAFAPSIKRRASPRPAASRSFETDPSSILAEANAVWNALQGDTTPQAASDAADRLRDLYDNALAAENEAMSIIRQMKEEFEFRIAEQKEAYEVAKQVSLQVGNLYGQANDAATHGMY